ncbi:hypothetical protein [Streptomyces axinellae]|uniref:Uncharacterized protein n=1 Tax=Streptomyces axinellae TaxID=552788 RepID=A0ABP6CQF4_9ACTN
MPKICTDEHYAAALNALEPGHLPQQTGKVELDIGGRTVDVPLGTFLSQLRSRGRKTLGRGLIEALKRHDLEPWKNSDDRWKIPQTGKRTRWSDEQYAAALNALEPGDLPKKNETVDIGGGSANVRLGQFLHSLRHQGRGTALKAVLIEALELHGLQPWKNSEGLWKIPQTGKRTTWRDEDYAAALNAREPGNPPKHRDCQQIVVDDTFTFNVPIGQFLHAMRNRGRKEALEAGLREALKLHGLQPVRRGDKWMIEGTTTQAESAGWAERADNEQAHPWHPMEIPEHYAPFTDPPLGYPCEPAAIPQGMGGLPVTAPMAPPPLDAPAAHRTTDPGGGYYGADGYPYLVNPVPAWANLPTGPQYWPAGPSGAAEQTPFQPPATFQPPGTREKKQRR